MDLKTMFEVLIKATYLIQTLSNLENADQYLNQLNSIDQVADWALGSWFFSFINGWRFFWILGKLFFKIVVLLLALSYYCSNYLYGHLIFLSDGCDYLHAWVLNQNTLTVREQPSEMHVTQTHEQINVRTIHINTSKTANECDKS